MEYYNQRAKTFIRCSLYFMVLLGSVMPQMSLRAQAPKKVKVFLMAGQSNMQGHGNQRMNRILCAMEHLDISDTIGCFRSISDMNERAYQAMNWVTYTDAADPEHQERTVMNRIVANALVANELIDDRLLYPSQQVGVVTFNYDRKKGITEPQSWSGPLKIGFGFTNNGVSFGPELAFGHRMAQAIDEDIVLVKVAEGGSNLYEMWRSPRMEARLGVSEEPSNYPLLKQHLNEVLSDLGKYLPKYEGMAVETEVAGFVWFQGFNDAVNGTYSEAYGENLLDFMADVREELEMPDLPTVIVQTNNSGNSAMVQKGQRLAADRIGNAETFTTEELSGFYHYNSGAYLVIGDRMGKKMLGLLRKGDANIVPKSPEGLVASVRSNDVTLQWADVADNEAGFIIERSQNAASGYTQIANLLPNTRSFKDHDLSRGTYHYRMTAYNASGHSAYATEEIVIDKLILPPWTNQDIGETKLTGSGDYLNGTFTIQGNGKEMHEKSDEFQYVYQFISGDREIIARVDSPSGGTDGALVGIMIRAGLTDNAPHATVGFNNLSEQKWESRDHKGGGTLQRKKIAEGQWLKLTKTGTLITAYSSSDGSTWEFFFSREIAISSDYYLGMMVNSGDSTSLAIGVFREVFVSGQTPATPPVAPSNLDVDSVFSDRVLLSWEDNSDNEAGFKLERATVGLSSGFQTIAMLGADVTSYEDLNLSPATGYSYKITAYNSSGETPGTNDLTVLTRSKPVAPSNLDVDSVFSDRILLSWADNSDNEAGFKLERATVGLPSGFQTIAMLGADVTSYEDLNLSPATGYSYKITAYNSSGETPGTNDLTVLTLSESAAGLPAPWLPVDVGSPDQAGHSSYSEGSFSITAYGEIWKKADDFHFVYQSFSGDGEIIARLDQMSQPDIWSRAGLMIRESLDDEAKNVMIASNARGRVGVQSRIEVAGATSWTGNTHVQSPVWLKLTRTGNLFAGYYSTDGNAWTLVQNVTLPMAESVQLGLAVSNFNRAEPCQVVFSQVSVSSQSSNKRQIKTSELQLDALSDVLIYPNPLSDVLRINSKEEVQVYLTDMSGRTVRTKTKGAKQELNLQTLTKGAYLLIIQKGHETYTHKIIKN